MDDPRIEKLLDLDRTCGIDPIGHRHLLMDAFPNPRNKGSLAAPIMFFATVKSLRDDLIRFMSTPRTRTDVHQRYPWIGVNSRRSPTELRGYLRMVGYMVPRFQTAKFEPAARPAPTPVIKVQSAKDVTLKGDVGRCFDALLIGIEYAALDRDVVVTSGLIDAYLRLRQAIV